QCLQETNRLTEAEASYREAVDMLEKLVSTSPLPEAREYHARALKGLGFALGRSKPAEAEKPFRQALEVANKLVQDYPDLSDYLSLRAEVLANLGGWCKDAGNLNEANKLYGEVLKIRLQLAGRFPTAADHQASLAQA